MIVILRLVGRRRRRRYQSITLHDCFYDVLNISLFAYSVPSHFIIVVDNIFLELCLIVRFTLYRVSFIRLGEFEADVVCRSLWPFIIISRNKTSRVI